MQKFKFLATQCAIAAPSPTRSPSASPVIHIRRRRKTLRMLLSRSNNGKRRNYEDRRFNNTSPEKGKELSVRHKLRDLFVSSPPAFGAANDNIRQGLLLPQSSSSSSGGGAVRMMRPLSSTFRQRLLLRRAWRPVLVAIPE